MVIVVEMVGVVIVVDLVSKKVAQEVSKLVR